MTAKPDAVPLTAKIRELAVNAVCPINRDPITPFEINMVKTFEEFGRQVAEAVVPSESAPIQSSDLEHPASWMPAAEFVATGKSGGDGGIGAPNGGGSGASVNATPKGTHADLGIAMREAANALSRYEREREL